MEKVKLSKSAYQEKLVRKLLWRLRKEKVISDIHVKDIVRDVHVEVGRSLDKAEIKRKADDLIFKCMKGELIVVKGSKYGKGKRIPLMLEYKEEKKLTSMSDEDFKKLTEEIVNKVVGTTEVVVKEEKKPEPPKVVEVEPAKKCREKDKNIRQRVLERLMAALSYSIKFSEGDGVSGSGVARVLGIKKVNQILVKTWISGLLKHSITLNVYYDGRTDKLVFREAKKDLSLCCELYKKITKKDPPREYLKLLGDVEKPKTLVSKTTSAVIVKDPISEKTIEEDQYGDLYYYAAGIIVEHGYKAVEIDSMCVSLGKLGYTVSKSELQGILRKRAEFNVVRYGAAIGLNSGGWKTWDEIKKKFDPRNNMKWVDCRLELTLNEIRKVFWETEVLSMVTERDGFYRVHYNGSLTELTKWIQLATISIGAKNLSNHIFDQDLVERIKTRVELLNEFMLKEELGCKLETL